MPEKRYRALRTVATIYKVLGWIVGVITILSVIGVCLISVLGGAAFSDLGRQFDLPMGGLGMGMGGILSGIVAGVGIILYGGLITLTLFAVGEGIDLAIAIETNTRTTAALLQQTQRPAPTQPPAPPGV